MYQFKHPHELLLGDIIQIEELIASGGQVSPKGLRARIEKASRIGVAKVKDEVVAVAAIKCVNNDYKERVFEACDKEEFKDGFEYEIGWVVTKEQFKRNGIAKGIINSLIQMSNENSYFATSKNDIGRHLMASCGFTEIGSYVNNNENEISLMIYTL